MRASIFPVQIQSYERTCQVTFIIVELEFFEIIVEVEFLAFTGKTNVKTTCVHVLSWCMEQVYFQSKFKVMRGLVK